MRSCTKKPHRAIAALSSSGAFIIKRGNHRRLLIGDALVSVSEESGVLSLLIGKLPQLGEKRQDVALSCAPPVDCEGCNLEPSFSSHHSLWLAGLAPRLEHTNSGMAVWESPLLVAGIERKRDNMHMKGRYHLGCQSAKWNKKNSAQLLIISHHRGVGGGLQMKRDREAGSMKRINESGNQSRLAGAHVRLWSWQAFRHWVNDGGYGTVCQVTPYHQRHAAVSHHQFVSSGQCCGFLCACIMTSHTWPSLRSTVCTGTQMKCCVFKSSLVLPL